MSIGTRVSLTTAAALAASALAVAGLGCFRHTLTKPVKPAATGGGDARSSATEWTGEKPADPKPEPQPGATAPAKRAWAEPVKLAGVGNCYKVSETLYRGEQPTPEGFTELKKLGIKTVVNLRGLHSDKDEIKESKVEGLAAEHIRFQTWHAEDEDVIKFLKTAGDPAKAPVFVHCMHGSDRTGLMCAIYRVVVQGWSKEEALEEMTKGPYGFHEVWKNLPKYFKELDVEKIRKEAGLGGK
ncbi:MAG TPA: tyrosine-protein phosphatase [Planctomycetota bacterium]|nr:tyrosine-protein phosphatase [Planctomycetota bacterium]